MAYSHPWDETQPLGSAAASTIDDIIRQLKVDVRERLNTIFVDFTADPVVSKAATGRQLLLAPTALQPQGFTYGFNQTHGADYVAVYQPAVLPIPVNAGWLIRTVEVIVDRSSVSTLSIDAQTRAFSVSPGGIGYGTIVHTATGITLVTVYNAVAGIPITTTSLFDLFFSISNSAEWRFYGARITYDIQ